MIKPITDDLVFGHIMYYNRDYVIKLIHYITNIPIEELQDLTYLDTNLKEDNREQKHQRSDIVTKSKDLNIILEMNQNPPKEYIEKNISYLFSIHNQNNKKKEKYVLGKVYLLLNFDFNSTVGDKLINKYTIKDEKGKSYPIRIEIYHIKLDKLQNKEYTKSVKEEILKYLKIMILTDEEELKKLSKGDDTLEHVVREMLHFEAKDIPLGYHDTEEEHRWMMNSIRDRHKEELKEELAKGIEQGEAKGIEKTAKTMLLKGYNVEEINDITKIPIDKIKKFKNTITIP